MAVELAGPPNGRSSPRLFLAVLGLGGLLGLAGLLWLTFGRVSTPQEGSVEVTFARDMAAHHAQAVKMAIALRERSADAALRSLALDIVLTQQNQIGQMRAWLALWGVPQEGLEPPMAGMGTGMGMATRAQINQLTTLPLAEAETQFLRLMIRHHQGGVAMALALLGASEQPQVRRLAQSIVSGQTSEIQYLESLLAVRGAELPAPFEPAPHSETH